MEKNIPFICPKCGKELKSINKSLICEDNHCYDIAKSGYVNLLLVNQKNSISPGDNKDMIIARNMVMNKNYYKKLADKIIEIIPDNANTILDAGCGIGYIPARIKNAYENKQVIGMDISKFAIESASKTYKNVHFAVASSNNIPLNKNSVDVIICAFAPVFIEEVNRILKQGGKFIRIIPNYDHLFNLKEYVYDLPRENEVDKEELDHLKLINTIKVRDKFNGDSKDMLSLIKMTPYYYHTNKTDLEKLEKLNSFTANQSFLIREYEKI